MRQMSMRDFSASAPAGFEFFSVKPCGSAGATVMHTRIYSGEADFPAAKELILNVRLNGSAFAERDIGIGKETYQLKPYDTMITPPEAPGHWRWEADGSDVIDIGLPKTLLAQMAAEHHICLQALTRAPHAPVHSFELTELAKQLHAERDPQRMDALLMQICLCLQNLTEAKGTKALKIRALKSQSLRYVIDQWKSALDKVWPLTDMAASLRMSPCHFLRAFQASTGVTPHDYLLHLRLLEARRLLKVSKRALDVALATGFRTQSHFTEVFRSHFGITPARFRSSLYT
jgi:AraC-like DNA-binding protein